MNPTTTFHFSKFARHGVCKVHLIMKMRLMILAVGLACGLSLGVFRASAELEVSAGVSIHAKADFYAPLAPHGTWVAVGSFGRCWRPAGVVAGWRPYCDGSWEWTDDGWYWVSDEPWAWACYHYGTWDYDSTYGWVWVPDVEWAPCWVNWRIGGGYIGWVPCTPPGVVIAPSFYVFVDNRHFNDRIRPNTIIVNNVTIIKKTKEFNGIKRENRTFDGRMQKVIVNEGPGIKAVERATGHKFTAVSVREAYSHTTASIPERFKNRTVEPAKVEGSGTIQPQPGHVENQTAPNGNFQKTDKNFRPSNNPDNITTPGNVPQNKEIPRERIVPQSPPGQVIPSPGHEAPVEKGAQKEVVPPSPGTPHESSKQGGGQGDDKDKDHGHGPDNP
jgi:Family of unknown function (DUF6600)